MSSVIIIAGFMAVTLSSAWKCVPSTLYPHSRICQVVKKGSNDVVAQAIFTVASRVTGFGDDVTRLKTAHEVWSEPTVVEGGSSLVAYAHVSRRTDGQVWLDALHFDLPRAGSWQRILGTEVASKNFIGVAKVVLEFSEKYRAEAWPLIDVLAKSVTVKTAGMKAWRPDPKYPNVQMSLQGRPITFGSLIAAESTAPIVTGNSRHEAMPELLGLMAELCQRDGITNACERWHQYRQLQAAEGYVREAHQALRKSDDFTAAIRIARSAIAVQPPQGSEEGKAKSVLMRAMDEIGAKQFARAEETLKSMDNFYLGEESLYRRQSKLLLSIARNAQSVERLNAALRAAQASQDPR